MTVAQQDLLDLLEKLRLPSGVECELVRLHSRRRSVGWAAGEPDGEMVSRSSGCSLRVLIGGGQGLVKDPDINEGNIEALFRRALDIAKNTPADPNRFLTQTNPPVEKVDSDPDVFTQPAASLLEELKELEGQALKTSSKLKKVVRLHFEEERDEKTIASSHGVRFETESTASSFLVEALAEEAGQTEVAWDALSRRFGGDIDKKKVVAEAARTAVASLGGKTLPSGVYTVLLHPRVGTQILSLLAQALSAEAVQTGRSFLKDKVGEKVGSSRLTIVDDPRRSRGLASVAFDDEAVSSKRLAMIENGVLKDYFFDLRTAKKAGRASNGRGFRSSLAAAPAPHATNFFVEPGDQSFEALISAEKKVFLLHDIMGLHMAEPVTGEFSFGAAGFLYENGKMTQAVRGMTLAGTVGDLLKNVTAVGKESEWGSVFGAPYLLVSGLTLSGH